ncbi:uncharacterized protein LOC110008305 [Amborella trichopoda]|uniref:uncharacterized protein LOC110008305 n=1 Tax=Amborella trichopoda TaxID=13333 RepID=UPI0009C13D9A|nr:uncharacterized protein LOC110008305 [Amborella trichopoda]|eukprot:XP_020530636.1 uncharacterized protein LOC110008305 [Amborella trichopoda]
MKTHWDALALMEPAIEDRPNAEIIAKSREEFQVIEFLMALRLEFESVRNGLVHKSSLPTLNQALSELIAEETKIKYFNSSFKGETIFAATRPQRPTALKQNQRNSYYIPPKNMTSVRCNCCKELGHIKYTCPNEKKPTFAVVADTRPPLIKYPPTQIGSPSPTLASPSVTFSLEQVQSMLSQSYLASEPTPSFSARQSQLG